MWIWKLFNSLEAGNAGPVRGVFLMPRKISLVDIIHCAIDIEVHNTVIYHRMYFGDWFVGNKTRSQLRWVILFGYLTV